MNGISNSYENWVRFIRDVSNPQDNTHKYIAEFQDGRGYVVMSQSDIDLTQSRKLPLKEIVRISCTIFAKAKTQYQNHNPGMSASK